MADCPIIEVLVEEHVHRVLTQYRESPKLLHMIRTYLRQAGEVIRVICDLPEQFDLDSAVGDQLTLIGERMGWPRCHCTCVTQAVFGFDCQDDPYYEPEHNVTGFCDDSQTWLDCGIFSVVDICIDDDELYRKFLQVRRYQMMSLYSLDDLTAAIQIFWGETAWVIDAGHGRAVISPGRELTANERTFLQLYPRVLPIPMGVQARFHFFTNPIFGFGEGWGGFCDEFREGDAPIITEGDDPLVTEDGVTEIITGTVLGDADWMCEINVGPYECTNIR
jgi:hypothetical protein